MWDSLAGSLMWLPMPHTEQVVRRTRMSQRERWPHAAAGDAITCRTSLVGVVGRFRLAVEFGRLVEDDSAGVAKRRLVVAEVVSAEEQGSAGGQEIGRAHV